MNIVITEDRKERIIRYLHSSIITFLGVFFPLLLIELQTKTFDDFWSLGLAGLWAVVMRTIVKALYEATVILLPRIIAKMKKK